MTSSEHFTGRQARSNYSLFKMFPKENRFFFKHKIYSCISKQKMLTFQVGSYFCLPRHSGLRYHILHFITMWFTAFLFCEGFVRLWWDVWPSLRINKCRSLWTGRRSFDTWYWNHTNIYIGIYMSQQSGDETIVGFTLTVVNDLCWFLSQFSTNCHEILQVLFSSDTNTLKESLKNVVYFKS